MMRGEIFKHWQIGAATLFSVVIIVGAYVLARGIQSPNITQASEETALLQAIATKDSNGDGLPDWQKSLYGIPINATTTDYFNLGMTDGEAVAKGLIVPKAIADIRVATSTVDGSQIVDPSLPPVPADGTLTTTFAQNFFMLFVSAKEANGGADLSESQMNDVANQALNSLSSSIKPAPDFKSARDLIISNSSTEAFTTFAKDAEAVLTKNTAKINKTDIDYFRDAVMNNDTTASTYLASISKMYRDSASGLAALPVPEELATDDLLLINTLMRLSGIDSDFTRATEDPLTAILALHQYQAVVTTLGQAFANIGAVYASSGAVLPVGTPGAAFVNVTANVTANVEKIQKGGNMTSVDVKQP